MTPADGVWASTAGGHGANAANAVDAEKDFLPGYR